MAGLCFLIAIVWHLPLLKRWHPKRPIPLKFHAEQPDAIVTMGVYGETGNLPAWNDPMVFALPSGVGFSSKLRSSVGTPKLSAESPLPPVVYRSLEIEGGGSFEGVEHLLMVSSQGPDREVSKDLGPSTSALQEGSVWRVSGPILERSPTTSSVLPVIVSPEALSPTVLEIAVNPNGVVELVLVQQGSGLGKADDAAVRFARGIRFSPVAAEGDGVPSWGRLKVVWRVEAPVTRL